jgi:hypothetical protein
MSDKPDEAKGCYPKKTPNSGTRPARPSDVQSIKGPRSKVDGGIKFPKTIRPGSK